MIEPLKPEDFYMPADFDKQDATWVAWPHDGQYPGYQMKYEKTWLEIVAALSRYEFVNIIVKDDVRRDHVEHQLVYFGIGVENVAFYIIATDDVWICDNGPLVVVNDKGQRGIVNWKFNGWGERNPYHNDNQVAGIVANRLGLPVFDAPLNLESGHEVNGKGSMLVTRSSVINDNRNPGWSQQDIEQQFEKFLGVTNTIWLTGLDGNDSELGPEETDCHVDLLCRFVNEDTVLYSWPDEYDEQDPFYQRVLKVFLQELKAATTETGKPLNLVPLPMPKYPLYSTSSVPTQKHNIAGGRIKLGGAGPSMWFSGYTDWHVANGVVITPIFGDENDERVVSIIREYFPGRDVITIDCRCLFEGGGLLHCVTKPQAAIPE